MSTTETKDAPSNSNFAVNLLYLADAMEGHARRLENPATWLLHSSANPAQPTQPSPAPAKAAQNVQDSTNPASAVPDQDNMADTIAPPPKRGPYRHKGFRRLAPWEQRRKAKRERQRRARAKLNRKVGRPSAYKQEFAAQANRLALLGLNDTQIMGFFNVTPPTFYSWTKKHPEFLNEIQRGRIIADAEVAHALYRRAIGYSHKAVHIFVLKNGQVVKVPYTKHYPPDVRACMFWLTNRIPEHWGYKVEPQGPGGKSIAPLIICVSSEEMPVAKAALTTPKSDGQIAAPQEATAPTGQSRCFR